MSNHEELGSLNRVFVVENAVSRNADTIESSAKRAHATNNCSVFQRGNDPADKRAEHHDVSEARDKKHGRPKQQSPKASPKGPKLAPELHAVISVIVTDYMLFRMIVLPHNGQFAQIELRLL